MCHFIFSSFVYGRFLELPPAGPLLAPCWRKAVSCAFLNILLGTRVTLALARGGRFLELPPAGPLLAQGCVLYLFKHITWHESNPRASGG
jgi:hypothetical protein